MPRRAEVDQWFKKLEHPLKDAMLRVREIILDADARMDECIKWQTPTFTFNGNLASFNPRSKAHVSLLFHTGAKIPGHHPGLEGGGDTARYMRIQDVADAEKRRGELAAVVASWCGLHAEGAAKGAVKKPAKQAATKKTVAKKAPVKRAAAKKTARR
ncbi:MAG: DUF1801 domain-containing protein [Myxococcota bacterium]